SRPGVSVPVGDVDGAIDPGEVEVLAQALVGAGDADVAGTLARPPRHAEDDAECGVVERGDLVEVDGDRGAGVIEHGAQQVVAERGDGGEVDRAGDRDHDLAVDVEVVAPDIHRPRRYWSPRPGDADPSRRARTGSSTSPFAWS